MRLCKMWPGNWEAVSLPTVFHHRNYSTNLSISKANVDWCSFAVKGFWALWDNTEDYVRFPSFLTGNLLVSNYVLYFYTKICIKN
jgi:hypothetical protein